MDLPGRPSAPDPAPSGSTPRFERAKHALRRAALTSVVVNAALGMWAIAGTLETVEARVLVTSLLVTACGVVALACGAAVSERRLGPLPGAGIVAAVTGFALLIAATWQDFDVGPVWRLGSTLVAIATNVAYTSLMSGIHLRGRARRLLPTAYALAATATSFLVATIWGFHPGDLWRLFGMVWVLLGAATVAAPIAGRLHPAIEGPPPVRHCPFCGAGIDPDGHRTTRCGSCSRRFRVVGG